MAFEQTNWVNTVFLRGKYSIFLRQEKLGGGHIDARAPQPLKSPQDHWAEVGQDACKDEQGGNGPRDEDGKTSSRDGEGLAQGILCQVPENQG